MAAVWLQQRAGPLRTTAWVSGRGHSRRALASRGGDRPTGGGDQHEQQLFRGSPEPSGICRPQDPAEVPGVDWLIDLGG